jgi:hypothetical protein
MTIETKLPRNDHWKILYKMFVFYADRKSKMTTTAGHRLTSEKKAFEHFPIGSNVNLCPAVAVILDFRSAICRRPSNDHSWAVWFQLSKWFQRRSILKKKFP